MPYHLVQPSLILLASRVYVYTCEGTHPLPLDVSYALPLVPFASLRLSAVVHTDDPNQRYMRVCARALQAVTRDIGVDFSRLIRRHVSRSPPPQRKCVIRFSAISSFHPRRPQREPLWSRFNGALIVPAKRLTSRFVRGRARLIDEHAAAVLSRTYVRTKRGGRRRIFTAFHLRKIIKTILRRRLCDT